MRKELLIQVIYITSTNIENAVKFYDNRVYTILKRKKKQKTHKFVFTFNPATTDSGLMFYFHKKS